MIGVDGICVMPIGMTQSEAAQTLPIEGVLQSTVADLVYLIDIYPFREGLAEIGAGIGGIGVDAIMTLGDDAEVIESTEPWYFSDRGFYSQADDDPANTYFEGRAVVPLVVDRQVPIAPEQERRLSVQFGSIELRADDRRLDNLVALSAIDGRRVRVRVVENGASLAEAATIFDGTGVRWSLDAKLLRLDIRDNGYRLDVPLHQDIYGGTGGADGNAAVAGMVKPVCYGRCLNITPVPIDPTNRVLQFHDGAVEAVDAVYDRGAPLDFDSDYADYATLAGASISSGKYGTCLAQGMIKLGATPAGLVTADVRGGKNADGVYIDRTGAIGLHLIRVHGGLSAIWVQSAAFSSLDSIMPYEVGWYWPQPITVAEALNQIMAGVFAFWGPRRDGRITVLRIAEPSATSRTQTLTPVELLSLERLEPPLGVFPPSWRRRVAYEWNWTVQRGEDLASGVTDERRQFLAEPFRIAANADVSVRVRHLLATDPPVLPSRFLDQTAAQNLADELQPLFGVQRDLYVGRVKFLGHMVDIGHTVRIVWPLYGLRAGKFFRVVGMREECDRREIELIFWG